MGKVTHFQGKSKDDDLLIGKKEEVRMMAY